MAAVTDDGSRAMERAVEVAGAFDELVEAVTGTGAAWSADAAVCAAAGKLEDEMETPETARVVREGGYRRVALQVPDELVPLSWALVDSLRRHLGDHEADVFVLGDTSYGSCCVDEVAAQHHLADIIVHYGLSCLSGTSRLPVHFVFGKLPMDATAGAAAAAAELRDAESARVLVVRDVRYDHGCEALAEQLRTTLGASWSVEVPAIRRGLQLPQAGLEGAAEAPREEGKASVLGHELALGGEAPVVVLYVGSNDTQAAQIVLQLGERCRQVLTLDPTSGRVTDAARRRSGALTKRFVRVQQAKDASVFGILVGTMGVRGYNEVLEHLTASIKRAGRKSYTFVMGKINPQKLANFPSIDAYVLVACPLNSLVDSKEFYRPVVTPLEVEVALGLREWTAEYSCAFEDLALEGGSPLTEAAPAAGNDADDDDDAPHFSLVTGGLVHAQIATSATPPEAAAAAAAAAVEDAGGAALTATGPRHITLRYSSPAADALAEQTFRGLEPGKGDKAPAAAVAGQTGTASALFPLAKEDSGGAR